MFLTNSCCSLARYRSDLTCVAHVLQPSHVLALPPCLPCLPACLLTLPSSHPPFRSPHRTQPQAAPPPGAWRSCQRQQQASQLYMHVALCTETSSPTTCCSQSLDGPSCQTWASVSSWCLSRAALRAMGQVRWGCGLFGVSAVLRVGVCDGLGVLGCLGCGLLRIMECGVLPWACPVVWTWWESHMGLSKQLVSEQSSFDSHGSKGGCCLGF
jgi:hypothetical protein